MSAFCARVSLNGVWRTIEEHYQAAKVFEDGRTGLSWQEAKGKQAVNQAEVAVLYSKLWNAYMRMNPYLMKKIIAASGLSDMFGQAGRCCQATELWCIRTAQLCSEKQVELFRGLARDFNKMEVS